MNGPAHIRSDHIRSLDGLRGLAALVVVISHISNSVDVAGGLFGRGGGQIGVMIFFVLSGYLMGILYLDRPFNTGQMWSYALHRGARVLPLFYIVVLLAMLVRVTGLPVDFYSGMDRGLYLLILIKGQSIFWTIPVEVHFYVAFVVLWAMYSKFGQVAMFAMACLGIALFIIKRPYLDATLLSVAPFFLCGVAISRCKAVRDRRRSYLFSAIGMVSFPLALFMFPRISALVFAEPPVPFDNEYLWHNPFCLASASGCLIGALCSTGVSSILSTPLMTYLGKISYSLYLLHMPVLLLTYRATNLPQWPTLFLLATLLSSTMVAAVTYRLFEAPARRKINDLFAAKCRPPRFDRPKMAEPNTST